MMKERTISGGNIGDEGAKAICEALKMNTALKKLILDSVKEETEEKEKEKKNE